ncbi:hypothetical protein B7R54_12345 [Subtercola boreus]|uniref:DUF3558 domain-containing protein n=1 Tax=Subtercola boreus TaxID=120213 RepID=A0A3E0VIW5_9MICO|nr:hypothetical protein [Subtercola boreus]RFA09904.1 hypothetical protein B7R54_12345 [Subtercola boreus]TQL52961.1 hypothetical protein FB464_0452 [Subtercola boreus]
MNPQPEFDPARSDAIRRMLVETVAAEQRSGAASVPSSTPGHSRRRAGIIVVVAVLTALVGSGTAALALNGSAWFGAAPPAPATTTAAPTSPAPTVLPTTAPPTPTVAPNPVAPVIRVPSTCEALLSLTDAEAILGLPVVPVAVESFDNPVFYTDRRLGALDCSFSGEGASFDNSQPSFSLKIVPGVTAEQYDSVVQGEGWTGSTPEDGIAPGAASQCVTRNGYFCAFIALVGDYGVVFDERVPATSDLTADQREQIRQSFTSLVATVGAFPAPAPLWQPEGATLTGATTCEELASDDELLSRFGADEVNIFKSDGGEYDFSGFHAGPNVGAFWCSWDFDRSTSGVSASVLPGGASYFAEFRDADPSLSWTAVTGYPGEAYVADSEGTTRLSILIDGGWVELKVPTATSDDTLRGFAATVLANVGG